MDSIRLRHRPSPRRNKDAVLSAKRASRMSRLATITCILLALVGGGALALFIRRQIRSGQDFKGSLDIAEAQSEVLREQAELLDLAYDTSCARP